ASSVSLPVDKPQLVSGDVGALGRFEMPSSCYRRDATKARASRTATRNASPNPESSCAMSHRSQAYADVFHGVPCGPGTWLLHAEDTDPLTVQSARVYVNARSGSHWVPSREYSPR